MFRLKSSKKQEAQTNRKKNPPTFLIKMIFMLYVNLTKCSVMCFFILMKSQRVLIEKTRFTAQEFVMEHSVS